MLGVFNSTMWLVIISPNFNRRCREIERNPKTSGVNQGFIFVHAYYGLAVQTAFLLFTIVVIIFTFPQLKDNIEVIVPITL